MALPFNTKIQRAKGKTFTVSKPPKCIDFPDVTNAFQKRFDELSNSNGNKGDRNNIAVYIL